MTEICRLLRILPIMMLLTVLPIRFGFATETLSTEELLTKLAPPPAAAALAKTPDFGRKLLALRSYLRMGSRLQNRWSWTEQEIRDFQGSAEQLALLAEIAAVRTHFARANPGFELYVNTKVRSLDVQLKAWNSNESVGRAAREILAAWERTFETDRQKTAQLDPNLVRRWLSGFKLSKRPNLAAPGLTRHGRASAIDFQVMKDGAIIAEPIRGRSRVFGRPGIGKQNSSTASLPPGLPFKAHSKDPTSPGTTITHRFAQKTSVSDEAP